MAGMELPELLGKKAEAAEAAETEQQ